MLITTIDDLGIKRKNLSKNKQMGPIKLKRFDTAKETITKQKDSPQNGRKYLQMKQLARINLQNILTAHAAQYLKKKMGRRLK